jgi:serine/threonine protein kinase
VIGTAAAFVCSACGQRYDHAGYCPHDGRPLTATDDPLLGTEVGRYRVARLLGEGGMGRVYLAVHPAIGSRVAIKILSDQCARSPELLERFFAEARAVNLVRHENIVGVLDLAQLPDGRPFIVMEYIEGQTLAGAVQAGPVPLGGLVQVMTEVLSALAAAHAIGIVHRDLKPDNVLITGEGHAKVLDFGIAKLAPELQQQLSPRTRTGALLGTPQYMAPEQISGSGAVDPRTDLYAAGVVLYELATGRQPFVGETLFDLMRAHLEQPPRPPRALRADIPAALEHVILTALAKRPDDRFADATAMAQALQQAAAALPAEQWRSLSSRASGSGPRTPSRFEMPMAFRPTQPVGPSPTVSRHRRRGRIAAGIAVAAAIGGAVLFMSLRTRPGDPPVVAAAGAGSEASPSAAGGGSQSSAAAGGSQSSGTAGGSQSSAGGASAGGGAAGGSSSGTAGGGAAGGGAAGGSSSGTAGGGAAGGGPSSNASNASNGSSATAPAIEPEPTRPGKHRRRGASGAGVAQHDTGAPSNTPGGSASTAGGPPSSAGSASPSAGSATPSAGSGTEPIIVGGGSAADHGVFIGPNVIIGSSQPPRPADLHPPITRPADYDARHFDPVAYLPRAQKLARELLPDAQLTSFEFDPVFSDGHIDLTVEGRDREYEFRSPARSVFPADRPRNLPREQWCRVHIEIGVREVSARILAGDCTARLVRTPRCSLASVWKQALAAGTPGDLVARIGWLYDEKWFFDIDLVGKGGGVSSFADRCP